MRPHSLVLENFGPFHQRAEVDFDRLGEFFLISGRTGSGKTTLFDGLMFALYGRTTGTRDEKNIFSHYARVGSIPSVTLEFTLGETRYKIIRRPPHRRPKKKGGGMVDVPTQEAELFELKGEEWTARTGKLSEVNALIREKIRLTADEFSKIVLLPQGEFQKFLEEKTKDRAEVLEKLFPTSEHGDIALAFKEHARERRDELRRLESDLAALAEKFDPAEYENTRNELIEARGKLDGELKSLRDSLVARNMKLQSAVETANRFARLRVLEQRRGDFESRGPLMEQNRRALEQARKAERVRPALEHCRVLGDDLSRSESEITARRAELESLASGARRHAEKMEQLPGLEKELRERIETRANLRSGLDDYRALRELQGQMESKRAVLRRRGEELARLDEHYESNVAVLESIKVGPAELDEKHRALETVRRDLMVEETREKEAREFAVFARTVHERRERIAGLEGELEEARVRLGVNERETAELEHRRDTALAATMAGKLVQGEPCPVCGSHEHPHPADRDVEPFTLEDRLKAAQANARDAASAVAGLEARLREERLNLEAESKRLEEHKEMPAPEAVRERITVLNDSVESLLAQAERVSQDLKRREQLRERGIEMENRRGAARTAVSGIEAELREMEGRARELGRGIQGVENPEQAMEELNREIAERERYLRRLKEHQDELNARRKSLEGILAEANKRVEELRARLKEAAEKADRELTAHEFAHGEEARAAMLREDEIHALENEIRNYENESREVGFEIAELEKALQGRREEDTVALKEAVREAEESAAETETKRDAVLAELNRLREYEQRRLELSARRANLGKESAALVNLADDLNGNNERKISFKNFVLGIQLEKVAARATRRLERMSEGRYSLLVTDAAYDGRAQTGLELDVFDANTGTRRNVRTLSGGEKFMASISLALGLADVIAERSGGIQLDAVFIDEGFGTLDDQALDGAIAILDDIRGSRTVGIISHVNELKSRIPVRIEVDKGKHGSKVRQVV